MFECVPNISEGRDAATIRAVAENIRAHRGVHLLNIHSDEDHNRSVFTYVSERAEALLEATLSVFAAAVPRIDLRRHRGVHPRVGAVDVVPFVPLGDATMEACVRLAHEAGQEIAARFDIPVYLYEEAATAEHRRALPHIRSGGFEKFAEKMRDPLWRPDYGPPAVHPTAGVSVVGARVPLIAFNVQLATDRLDVARSAARLVRASSGGLPHVRALGIELRSRNIVQVSMNLLDYRQTSIRRAFDVVRAEAERHGVRVLSSELVGLAPAEALRDTADMRLAARDVVLEERIRAAVSSDSR